MVVASAEALLGSIGKGEMADMDEIAGIAGKEEWKLAASSKSVVDG